VVILKIENGDVRERRCTKCNKILAAYLVGEEALWVMSVNLKIKLTTNSSDKSL